jgi:hypothetical protein
MTNTRIQSELVAMRVSLLSLLDLVNNSLDAKITEKDLFDFVASAGLLHIEATHSLGQLANIDEDYDEELSRPTRQTPQLRIVA